jgi:hypothetical protein
MKRLFWLAACLCVTAGCGKSVMETKSNMTGGVIYGDHIVTVEYEGHKSNNR